MLSYVCDFWNIAQRQKHAHRSSSQELRLSAHRLLAQGISLASPGHTRYPHTEQGEIFCAILAEPSRVELRYLAGSYSLIATVMLAIEQQLLSRSSSLVR